MYLSPDSPNFKDSVIYSSTQFGKFLGFILKNDLNVRWGYTKPAQKNFAAAVQKVEGSRFMGDAKCLFVN